VLTTNNEINIAYIHIMFAACQQSTTL